MKSLRIAFLLHLFRNKNVKTSSFEFRQAKYMGSDSERGRFRHKALKKDFVC